MTGDSREGRKRRSAFEYAFDDRRDEKRGRHFHELGDYRDYHGSIVTRDRPWIGRGDCDRRSRMEARERFVASSRDREREWERSRNGLNGKDEGEEKARTYQLEVLAQAKVKITVAFLDTGAGKTLIAILLMKHKHQVLREYDKRMLALFSFWDARGWQREFDTKDVFVMTAQILLNILRHSIVKMEAIHLLILDECHHAVKKHPYSLVMSEFYLITPKDKRPCVFGMIASPVNLKGVSNQEDCAIKIRNLESKLDSIVCTIRDRKELEKHVPLPSETMILYDKPALLFSLRKERKQMEATVEKAANASVRRSKWKCMGARDAGAKEELQLVLSQKLRAITYALDELGQWCAYKVSLGYLTSLHNDERVNHQLDVKFQKLYLKKVCTLLRCSLREGAAGSRDPAEHVGCADFEDDKIQEPTDVGEGELPDSHAVSVGEHLDEILGAAVADGKVTPKVQSLIKVLIGYQHTDDFRAIIFVERVIAAQVLPKVFAELPSLKFMQETISKFRDGRVTLLVATSVAEEGLDIRQCNVVIRFDLAKTVLAYIQSRGRARKPGSDYILMLERGNLQHEAFFRNAKNSEETLRKEAIERTDLGEKRENAILASIDIGEGEIYQVPATGAVVSMNSAVGLIHFYCSQLPSDRYSLLRPEFIMNKIEDQRGAIRYSCRLQLPCNAPFEAVEGPECNSMRGAQQVVCVLEGLQKMHEMGAFTDMLLSNKGSREEAAKLEGSEEGESLPGTSRHREYYPEGIADILKGDRIVAEKDSDTKEGSKVLVFIDSLLTETSDFTLLVGQQLHDEVLTMTINLFVARTMTTRASLKFFGDLNLSLQELTELKSFHVRLMSIVLDVNVEPATTRWDPAKAYLFAPVLHKDASDPKDLVDWVVMRRTIETDSWSNPLQRASPDVNLGTDERALGGDRREYGFGKLRCSLAFGQGAHPTYGARGAKAQFDVVKATGLLPTSDMVEETTVQEVPPEGKLLIVDGFVEVEVLVGRIVTAVHSGKRLYVDSVRFDMTADSSFPQKDGYLVLGDIFESIAGALFLDTRLDTHQVWKVFEPLLQPMVSPETLPIHPVRGLQERCQQEAEGLEYKVSRAESVATVEVYVDGVQIGSTQSAQKKMAQKLGARNALVKLKDKEVIKVKAEAENGDLNAGKSSKNGHTNFTRKTINDLCLKRQWPMPQYKCVLESGPAHAKKFTFSVRVLTTTDGWTEECVGEPMASVKKAKDSAALVLLAALRRSYPLRNNIIDC
uniref:Uncharacterized protein n=1 Tax=Physcomitrium patens TaxID=3218 RepID=A0A2K1L9L0_PHYPA|nr:hypothetical protein PHYPA_001142 [Physcomitrium patens]